MIGGSEVSKKSKKQARVVRSSFYVIGPLIDGQG